MKQKFFAGLLCMLPLAAFSQNRAGDNWAIAANTNSSRSVAPQLTVTSDDFIVTHGKLAPGDEEMSANAMETVGEQIKVYPDPQGEYIFVETGFVTNGDLRCVLYDTGGKQLMNMLFTAEAGAVKRIISAGKLEPGTYFLQTLYNGGDVASGTIFTINKR